MYLSAFFTNLGVPAESLSPTITVIDCSDNSIVIDAQVMTEVGVGWYKYNFTTHDQSKEYEVTCYESTLPTVEKYVVFTLDAAADVPTVGEIADAVFDEVMSGHNAPGTAGYALEMIRKIEMGRWKLTNNTMTFYDDNGTTPILSFNITDKNGDEIVLDDSAPAERTPV